MLRFKNILPVCLFSLKLCFCNMDSLIIKPELSFESFSSGSIHNTTNNSNTKIAALGLEVSKTTREWSVFGSFKFTTASNFDLISTYVNPDLSFEHARKYISSDITWYESSSLLVRNKKNKYFNWFFGKNNFHWGSGESSLILSRNCPTFPMVGFDWQVSSKLEMSYFLASLSSQIEDTTNNINRNYDGRKLYIPRSVAGHKVDYHLTNQLKLSAMEIVIFGNRKIDENYLLPFIPFWSMQHYIGDIDNVQLCGEISWTSINKNLSIHASIFIDEWRPEWTFKDKNRNWFGYLVGVNSKDIILPKDNLKIEYTWTDHRIYRHKFKINSSYTYDYPIGFWAGPHSEYLLARYFLMCNDITFRFDFSFLKRGELTQAMIENQYNDMKQNDERYNNLSEERLLFGLNLFKSYFDKRVKTKIGLEWIGWLNAGFDPHAAYATSKEIQKLSINLSLTSSTDLIFN